MKNAVAILALLAGAMAFTPAMARGTDAILAVSWQPAFCEGHGDKPECETQSGKRFDASHFSLHGLWPVGKEYCDVPADVQSEDKSGDWSHLPALSLSDNLWAELKQVMPGTQSHLERHEWVKHGTCTTFSPENYYQTAVELLHQLNTSAVADVFQSSVGKPLTAEQIGKAFDDAYGRGASRRVKISCVMDGDRQLIGEITIGLSSKYAPGTSLEDLIQGAGGTAGDCDGGIVDGVGNQ